MCPVTTGEVGQNQSWTFHKTSCCCRSGQIQNKETTVSIRLLLDSLRFPAETTCKAPIAGVPFGYNLGHISTKEWKLWTFKDPFSVQFLASQAKMYRKNNNSNLPLFVTIWQLLIQFCYLWSRDPFLSSCEFLKCNYSKM